ncbi:MAG TPA: hypothetical protein VLF63_00635 [Patescibacteria group bacterium]|nr:hypothetical protein [Patescibacteria group bacterium]
MSEKESNTQEPIQTKPIVGPKNNSRMIMALVSFVVLIVIISLVAFHGKSKKTGSIVTPPKIEPAQVQITSTGFNPSTINIRTGQAVVWINDTSSDQSVVNDNPSPVFRSSVIRKSNNYTYVFNQKGSYAYHDSENLKFAGEVVVK